MPFCTNCGNSVTDDASYCPQCGAFQPGGKRWAKTSAGAAQFGPTAPGSDMLRGISDRTAAILCYIPVFGVIPAIIFLASQRFRHNPRVRFDGFQSLYLFVTWLIISSAAPTLFFSGVPGFGLEHGILGLLKLAVLFGWIYLLVKASQEQQVRLPIIGDLAARSTTEQL